MLSYYDEYFLQVTLSQLELTNLLFVYYSPLVDSLKARIMGRSIFSKKEAPPDLQVLIPPLIPQLSAKVMDESQSNS